MATRLEMPRRRFDPDLLEAARSGEQAAICRLLEEALPDLRRYARLTCWERDHVDDAVQESMWIIHRKLGTIRTVEAFTGWLFTVVRRECMRLGRALSRQDRLALAAPAPVERRSTADLRIALCDALESLPLHYREVVILRDMEELTIDEIGSALGKSRESVKALLRRARGLLREYLAR